MPARSRSRTIKGQTGAHYTYPSNSNIVTQEILTESIDDTVGPGNGFPLKIERYTFGNEAACPKLHGVYVNAQKRNGRFENYPVGFFYRPNNVSGTGNGYNHQTVGGVPSTANAATEIAAMTNPSRPLIDLPVFLGELKDLPDLLFKRSKDIGNDISRGRLSAEFGWKPLIGDLVRLLEFKQEFNKRVKEIDSLRTSGLRRKRKVFSGSSVPLQKEMGYIYTRDGVGLQASQTLVTTVTVTGFVKWVPDVAPPKFLGMWDPSPEIQSLMALLGVTDTIIDASTIWELIPFSWLVDWCSNAGDYLAAYRNTVGAHIEEILIMKHTQTESVSLIRPDTSTVSQFVHTNCLSHSRVVSLHETKERTPASLSLATHMPFLNTRQVTILSDLVRSSRRWGRMPRYR